MTNQKTISQKSPFIVPTEEGKTYFWCACGKSQKQPFCDGSHSGTGVSPIMYKATKTGNTAFCGCRHSNKLPLCDGSHGGF